MSLSKWYKWGNYKQGDGTSVIRRYRKVKGKILWETYPKAKYKDFSVEEIQALIRRMNVSWEVEAKEAQKRYDFDHAYVNKVTLGDFELYLTTRANSKEHVKSLMSELNSYSLDFFINKSKNPDPNQWKKLEAGFGQFLLTQKISSTYIKRIVQTTNRFIKFLHDRYPNEMRLTKLEPVAGRILKEKDLNSPNTDRKKFITEEHFEKICEEVDESILSAIKLAYFYGLRRAEVLALTTDDIFEAFIELKRQLISLTPMKKTGPIKNREQRDVPHWFCTPEDAFELILSIGLIHPDTLGHRFDDEMERLELPYQFHDLRRTFITRALRKYHYLDVMHAAGHSDLETTNKYIQDDRDLKRKKFQPTTAKTGKAQ